MRSPEVQRLLIMEMERFFIQKAQSACLDFLYGKYDLLTFYGRHAMERRMQREPVTHGSHVIGSVKRNFKPSV